MQMIKPREVVYAPAYVLAFYFPGHVGHWGYSFDCDAAGVVIESALRCDAARDNLRKCRAGEIDVLPPVVESFTARHVEPGEGRCSCGAIVQFFGGDETCSGCGRDYNGSGQELAPRSQWGEETGETAADYDAGYRGDGLGVGGW